MKSHNSTSPDNVSSESMLVDFARHLRAIHFLIIFFATFLIVVSLQLPISPIQKSIDHIQEIKVLQQVALSDSPTSEANILSLIVARKLNESPSGLTEALPASSFLKHKERMLSIKWTTVLPLVEIVPSSNSGRKIVFQSIRSFSSHNLQTFDDFRQLWDWYNRTFNVHMLLKIASEVLVLDQPQPHNEPSATIQDLRKVETQLGLSSPLELEDHVSMSDFVPANFPYVPFTNNIVAAYMQKIADPYNIILVFRAESTDIRTPTTVIIPVSTKQVQIQSQSGISSLANASWVEGLFVNSFSDLQAIMHKIKDDMINTFDIELVRKVYPTESRFEQQTVNILGITINGIQMLSWGPGMILTIQLYFFILCRQFYQNASSSSRSLVFPWIGLSRDVLGRLVYFTSITVLPVFALFYSIGVLRYSPISQYEVLVYLRYVAAIFAALTARIIIYKEWRKPKRA